MKRLSPATATVVTVCLMFLTPGLAAAEWPTQSGFGLHPSQNLETGLRFPKRYALYNVVTDGNQNALSSSAGRPGYWFADFPWLGLAPESCVLNVFEEDEDKLATSIDADTDFDPLSSFILFRYRNWKLEPFVGIGPSLIFYDLGRERPNSLNHMFLGVFYSF
jgi:hypothetical protein